MTYNSIVLADSPKHYVTFDQSGTLTDTGSAASTLSGGVSQTTDSISGGKAGAFNGTSQTIGIVNSYDFSATATWSFETWFKTTDTTTMKEIIRKDGNGRAYLLRVNGQNIEWYCNVGPGFATTGTNYSDGKWHHVVGTYSSTTMKLYIDGVQYGTTQAGNAGTQGSPVTTWIGSSGGNGEYFNGTLDELAIYPSALTQTQVTAHYNAGNAYKVALAADAPTVHLPFSANALGTAGVGSRATTLTASAGVTWGTGISDSAPVFSGSTTATYAEYSIATANDIFNTGTWTMETWFKKANTTDALGYHEVVNSFDTNNQVVIYGDDNTGHVALWYNFAGGARTKLVGPLINDTNWHHAVAASDGTTVHFYVDGVDIGTTGPAGVGTFGTSTPLWVAAYGTAVNNENWHGSIDEVALWKGTALSQARVQAHYIAGGGAIPNVTVTPPAMTGTLTEVAPVVAGPVVDSTVAVPAMTLSLTEPTPVVTANQGLTVTNSTGTLAAANTYDFGFGYTIGLQFATPTVPAGKRIQSATLVVGVTNQGGFASAGHTFNVKIDRYATTFGTGSITTTHEATGTLTAPSGAATTEQSVDVTNIVKDWQSGSTNAGIQLSWIVGGTGPTGEYVWIPTASPYTTLQVALEDIPPTPVTVTAPVMTQSMTAPAPSVSAGADVTEIIPPITSTLSAPAPVVVGGTGYTTFSEVMSASLAIMDPSVSATGNKTVVAPVMTASITDPAASVVIVNPDYTASAPAMVVNLTMPTPVTRIEVDAITHAVPVSISLETEPATINTVTNVLTAPSPFSLTGLRMVGIYNDAADRYHNIIPTTIDADDVWYKMNESMGTKATDSSVANVPAGTVKLEQDGQFFGTPVFGAEGPQLRKAVTFNGSTDYLLVGPYSTDDSGYYTNTNTLHSAGMDLTVEFSIRTTQLDGTIFNASGGADGALASISQTAFPFPIINGYKLNLSGGYLNIVTPSKTYKVKTGFVSDGKWHHIVLSVAGNTPAETTNSQFLDDAVSSFLMVDGNPVLVRKGAEFGNGYKWIPFSFMADSDFNKVVVDVSKSLVKAGPGKNVKGYLAGDLSEVVVRLNSNMSEVMSQSVYYEWSDSSVVKAQPIQLSLEMPKVTAKSNMKKMLAVYGLGWGYASNTGFPLDTYMSTLSGMVIDHMSDGTLGLGPEWPHVIRASSANNPSAYYWKPVAFRLNEELMVYPVSIRGNSSLGTAGLQSLNGFIDPDASTDSTGYFVDDTTGLPRFIDLQNDLAVDVTDFDVLTVVNYPWIDPEKGYDMGDSGFGVSSMYPMDGQLDQHRIGLTDTEWEDARDALRDSILDAAYNGVSLWIGEIHMAQHLGFIQGFDAHSIGYELYGTTDPVQDLLGANIGILENEHAQALDRLHLNRANPVANGNDYLDWLYHAQMDPVVIGAMLGPGGTYMRTSQLNAYRRVHALMPGLTDLPAYDRTPEQIEAISWNRWLPNGDFWAYNVQKRPNGYQIGDYSEMDVVFLNSLFHGDYGVGGSDTGNNKLWPSGDHLRRSVILSAKPQGIVGTVINTEIDGYWGPAKVKGDGGTWIPNPYANNAVTIAAEVGSIVRGRPIKGRAFMEFMETSLHNFNIVEDENKDLWMGDSTQGKVSFWDFDSRRAKEIKVAQTYSYQVSTRSAGSSDGVMHLIPVTVQYIVSTPVSLIANPHSGWHFKGLHWLGLTPTVDLNDSISYPPAIQVSLVDPTPTVVTEKNEVVTVAAINAWIELRNPANFAGGDVNEFATPMELAIHMGGLGSINVVPPMTASLSTAAPRIIGDVDLVTVYVDSGTSITLYLKEDN